MGVNPTSDILINSADFTGIVTAYQILKQTQLKVAILNSNPTSYNIYGVSQIKLNFKYNCQQLLVKYGPNKTKQIYKLAYSGWSELKKIYSQTKITSPCQILKASQLFASEPELLAKLKEISLFAQLGLPSNKLLIAQESVFASRVPSLYQNLITLVPKTRIQKIADTHNHLYIGLYPEKCGLINVDDFVEKLTLFLLKKYPQRFHLLQHLPVTPHLKIKTFLRPKKYVTYSGYLCLHGKKTPLLNSFSPPNISLFRFTPAHSRLVCLSGPNPVSFLKSNLTTYSKFPQDLTIKYLVPIYQTKTSLAIIGQDQKNKKLFYNLPCSGSEILTSLLGGHRLAKLLSGHRLSPSPFDP